MDGTRSGDEPRPAVAAQETAAAGGSFDREDEVRDALRQVMDPELGVNIVDLGLIYGTYLAEGGYVEVTMTATTPGCPLQAVLVREAEAALRRLPWARRVVVNLVWTPPWTPDLMTADGRRQLGWG